MAREDKTGSGDRPAGPRQEGERAVPTEPLREGAMSVEERQAREREVGVGRDTVLDGPLLTREEGDEDREMGHGRIMGGGDAGEEAMRQASSQDDERSGG